MKTRVDNLEKILGRERVELEAQHEIKNALYVKTIKMYLEGGVKEALDKGVVPFRLAGAADEEDSEGDEAPQDENIPTFQRRVLAKREKLYDLVIDDDDWKSNEVNNATMRMRSSSSYNSSSVPGKSSSSVSRL
jgi:hypothetical protein